MTHPRSTQPRRSRRGARLLPILLTALMASAHADRPREVALCLHPGLGNRVTAELKARISNITAVMPMSLEIEATGDVSLRAGSTPSFAELSSLCATHGVALMPVARNFKPAAMLSNARAPMRAASNLIAWARREKFSGYLLDIEHHTVDQRGPYHHFISNVARELTHAGLQVQVAVSPFNGGEWDYGAIAGQAHRVFAMLYDYGAPWTPRPGATAPLSWPEARRDVLRDTARILSNGVPPEKLLLGLGFYGTHYEIDGAGKTSRARQVYFAEQNRLYEEACARPDVSGKPLRTFDGVAGNFFYEVVFKDGSRVKGWTEDAPAHRLRLDKVRAENLAGVGIWALIEKDPHDARAWPLLGALKFGSPFPVLP